MDFVERIAERRIRTAQAEGRFERLAGRGRPLELEDDSGVPEDLRLAYRILKNAGCLPPEVELRREILTLGALIESIDDDTERARLVGEANLKILQLNSRRQGHVRADVEELLLRELSSRSEDPSSE